MRPMHCSALARPVQLCEMGLAHRHPMAGFARAFGDGYGKDQWVAFIDACDCDHAVLSSARHKITDILSFLFFLS